MRRKPVDRHNPLIVNTENFDPLFDEISDEEQEMMDERGAYEPIGSGVKRRKPIIHDDF